MHEDEFRHKSTAAVNIFPLNFGAEGAGDARFYRSASGELIPDGGAWQCQGNDENGCTLSFVQCCRDRT